MFWFGMITMISKPTSVTMHTATGINHLFTNTIMNNIEIKTAIVKTDFWPFSYHLCYKKENRRWISEQCIFKSNILDQSINKFKQKLSNIDWNNIKILQNPNDAHSKFLEFFFLVQWMLSKIQCQIKTTETI